MDFSLEMAKHRAQTVTYFLWQRTAIQRVNILLKMPNAAGSYKQDMDTELVCRKPIGGFGNRHGEILRAQKVKRVGWIDLIGTKFSGSNQTFNLLDQQIGTAELSPGRGHNF